MLANAMRICEAKFGICCCTTATCSARSRAQRIRRPRRIAATDPVDSPGRSPCSAASCRTQEGRSISPTSLAGIPITRRSALVQARWRAHAAGRADAQGERADRRHRHLPPGGPAVHRQADRAGQTSPRRPSSPSRTRGCSTSCANRCSSRPPPPTCSRSSAARPSIFRPCSIRLSKSAARLCEADIGDASFGSEGDALSVRREHTASRRNSTRIWRQDRMPIQPDAGTLARTRRCSKAESIHIRDVLADPEYDMTEAAEDRRALARAWRSAAARGNDRSA